MIKHRHPDCDVDSAKHLSCTSFSSRTENNKKLHCPWNVNKDPSFAKLTAHLLQINIIRLIHSFGVNAQDFQTTNCIWDVNIHLTIKPSYCTVRTTETQLANYSKLSFLTCEKNHDCISMCLYLYLC